MQHEYAKSNDLYIYLPPYPFFCSKNNQGNQGYSGNQKNAIQGQKHDMENRHTQQRTYSN